MKRIVIYFSNLLLMFYCSSLVAQDSMFLSLQTIFQKIETFYPEILMYESKIKSIEAQSQGVKSWMPPVVSFGLDRFPYEVDMIDSKEDPMNQAGIMISLEQMIPNQAKQSAKQEYISSLAIIQESNTEWLKNVLRGNAKLLYYQRYIAERKMKTVDESLQLIDLMLATAEERYKYNQSDLSTIYKAQAKKADLKNMRIMLQSQIAESNIGLNILMNRDINTLFRIDTIIELNPYASLIYNDTLVTSRSDISAVQYSIASMGLNQQYMSSFSKPDFGIKFQHMQMFGMPNQFSVMGMMTIPIVPWSSQMYRSEVESMGYEISAMQYMAETMQLMAERMIKEKLAMLKYEHEQLGYYEDEILPAYQKNFETSLLTYKQNTGSLYVLLDAWEMVLMKEMEYLDKYFSILKLQTEYEFESER